MTAVEEECLCGQESWRVTFNSYRVFLKECELNRAHWRGEQEKSGQILDKGREMTNIYPFSLWLKLRRVHFHSKRNYSN